jgi:hypothetical protein
MSNRNKDKGTPSSGKKRTRKSPVQIPVTSVASVKISSEDSDHLVLRDRITVILNQLKSQKLNMTVHKLKSMAINNEGKLNALVKAIFEKAVNDKQNGEVYAKLCQHLSTFQVISVASECACFKDLLVEHSRQEFQTCFSKNGSDASQQWYQKMDAIGFWSPASRSGSPLTDSVKLKKMGIVMFLGQLFKSEILTVNFMRVLINTLFSRVDEDVWDCLCCVLLLIGSDMEAKKQDVALCLMKMQEMVSKRQLPANARNQLNRVIECRRNKWRPVETVYSEHSSTLKQFPPRLSEDHEENGEHDAWALGTLTHIVVPRRVLRNQLRQAKNRFNHVQMQ